MDNYRKIEIKGKGSYGQAMLVQQKSDRLFFIMKIIDVTQYDRKQKEASLNEINVLKSLFNPFVVRYRESFVDKNRYLCIVMDYADDGNLDQKIQIQRKLKDYFSEEQILDWFTQICLGLKYIHDKKIIHRDLKSQNIFLTKQGQIKLGDFGIAKTLSSTEELCQTSIGTPYYISPEICQHIPYNHKSDMWSLGCILFELLTLRHAFDAKNLEGLFIKIMRGQTPQIPSHYSSQLRELVQELLKQEPELRPSINDILKKDFMKQRVNQILKVVSDLDEPSQKNLDQSQIDADQIEQLRCQIEEKVPLKEFLQIYKILQSPSLFLQDKVSSFDQTVVKLIQRLIDLEQLIF